MFELVLSGIQTVARQQQIDILVVQGTPKDAGPLQLAQQRVDGWIVVSYTEGIEFLVQQGKPIVTVAAQVPNSSIPAVIPDNKQGIDILMEHLCSQGHERIAFVGYTTVGDIQDRYVAYQENLIRRGIPVDPELAIITDSPMIEGGEHAVERLIALDGKFTAIVVGNDWNALGLMPGLQAHGYRIPEDIAIVSFDDIFEAQVAQPPLSTIRQRFDELGTTAATVLLDLISGGKPDTLTHFIPTTFLPRQSSGLRGAEHTGRGSVTTEPVGTSWGNTLARSLVSIVMPSVELNGAKSALQFWPEVNLLVQALSATLEGTTAPQTISAQSQAALSSTAMLHANSDDQVAVLRLLERTGFAISAHDSDREERSERLRAFIDQLFLALMHAHQRRQAAQNRRLDENSQHLFRISRMLMQGTPEHLHWLRETPVYSGCLARWSPTSGGQQAALTTVGAFHADDAPRMQVGTTATTPHFPPLELLPSSANADDIVTCLILPVEVGGNKWGILALSGRLVSDDPQTLDSRSSFVEVIHTLIGIALEREELQSALQQAGESERLLADTVRELSCPVIPLMDGVLLAPLVGTIDSGRAQQIIAAVLEGITTHHARYILLDISGVPTLDTRATQVLIQATQAATLLGSRVTLVGIRPEIAQNMVALGTNLDGIKTQGSLAAALDSLLRPSLPQSRSGRVLR